MFFISKNNSRIKIVDKLVLNNCFLLGQAAKLTNKNFTRFFLGLRYSLEIFKFYEIRHLLLKTYPLIYNLFCRKRNLYDRIVWRKYPRKIKKKELEEYQKINPNWDGKTRFYSYRVRKNIPPKILFATSTAYYADIVEEAAVRCQMPWQTEQWLNGSITATTSALRSKKKWNFDFDYRQIEIEENFRSKYGKNKEDVEYTEEKKKIYGQSHWPSLILIPDVKNNGKLIEETKEAGIPVLGLVSSDCQLIIDYPILAQDMSIPVVHFFCHFMATLIAKEMVKMQHKLFIKTKSGLLKKDRNFFDKKISSRFWYFKHELDNKHNAKKKPKIFILQQKFIFGKRRINSVIRTQLILPWEDRAYHIRKIDANNSDEYDFFYSFFYNLILWPSGKMEKWQESLKNYTKNTYLQEKKYLFFLFEIFRKAYTFFQFVHISNVAGIATRNINMQRVKKKKLLNKNIYWTNPEQKRALIKTKKNNNFFENILIQQWYNKKNRLRYNSANKMYYWISLWILIQTPYVKRLAKKFRKFRTTLYHTRVKKKWAYQKYKRTWRRQSSKKIFKNVTKKGVLLYFLKKLTSEDCTPRNSYTSFLSPTKRIKKHVYQNCF